MIFHLHIEKTGGKTIESNVARALGERCFRTSQRIPALADSYDMSEANGVEVRNPSQYLFVTGHYYFGLHRFFPGVTPTYVSIIREPVARLKSYFNYVLNSPMYDIKQFFVDNRMTFEQFALGDFDVETAPLSARHNVSNGQAKMLAASDGTGYDADALYDRAMENVGSVDYHLFTTPRSTEAYCFILSRLGKHPFRRYIVRNRAPYDHVGSIPATLRSAILEQNPADARLYEAADRMSASRKDLSRLRTAASLVRGLGKLESTMKAGLPQGVRDWIRPAPSAPQQDAAVSHSQRDGSLLVPHGDKTTPLFVLSNDLKADRYSGIEAWDTVPHRIWRSAVKEADLVIDAGSNYGEFIVCLDDETVGDAEIISLEANPYVAACQRRTIGELGFRDQVRLLAKAASSAPGTAEFHVSHSDSGSSSLVEKPRSASLERVELVTLDHVAQSARAKANPAIKIDVEGHDVEVLKGALATLTAADFYFVTLEFSMGMWPDLQQVLSETEAFAGRPQYVFVWNSLFRITDQPLVLPEYHGNLDFYITNMVNTENLLEALSSPFKTASVLSGSRP